MVLNLHVAIGAGLSVKPSFAGHPEHVFSAYCAGTVIVQRCSFFALAAASRQAVSAS